MAGSVVDPIATAFEYRNIGHELNLCQRYYYNTWSPHAISPSAASQSGAIATVAGNQYGILPATFPVQLRASPTVYIWSINGVINSIYNWNTGAHIGSHGPSYVTTKNFTVGNGGGGLSVGNTYLFHYAAHAEF